MNAKERVHILNSLSIKNTPSFYCLLRKRFYQSRFYLSLQWPNIKRIQID